MNCSFVVGKKVYGSSEEGLSYSGRFMQVIKEAYRQTGRGVVVLIDEYDKPLLRSMHNPELQDKFANAHLLYCTEISRPLVALRLYHRSDQNLPNGYIQHSQPA